MSKTIIRKESPQEITPEEVKEICQEVIELHDRMQGSYFWSPPGYAAGRRSYEERYSVHHQFEYENNKYDFECHTECSCKNIYYKGYFYKNNERKDIRIVKKLLKNVSLQK